MSRSRRVVLGVAVAYLALLVPLAFLPWSQGAHCPWYLKFSVFLPVGVLLTLLFDRRRWWAALGFGILGAAWFEAAQGIWMPDGYGRIEDAMWGAIGVLVGGVVALSIRRFMRSHIPFRIVTEGGRREIPQD